MGYAKLLSNTREDTRRAAETTFHRNYCGTRLKCMTKVFKNTKLTVLEQNFFDHSWTTNDVLKDNCKRSC